MDKRAHDLIDIIQFTENVSLKIHGVHYQAEIYNIIKEEFARSERYTASLLSLTDDKSKLRIAESSIPPGQVKEAEKASGTRMKGYKIDLNRSSIYSQVVREGKTLQVNVSDIIGELFPRPIACLISKTMGYEKKPCILTPLKQHGEIIGAFAMSSTRLAEYIVPSVKIFAQHISTALELADEYARRRRMEEALRIKDSAIASSINAIAISDLQGSLTYINPSFLKLWGYDYDEEILGKLAAEFWQVEEKAKGVQRALLERGNWIGELVARRKDGSFFDVQLSASTVTDDSGKPICMMASFIDITAQKHLEKQLQIRQRMDSLGTLVGGIAHDFNNILVGITGYINLLNSEAGEFTEAQKEYLKNAERSCERAADLVSKFQSLSKGSASEKTNVDLYESANEVFSVLKEITDRLIEKKIDLKPGEFYVRVSASDLNQVLLNLGTNAVHAIEERGLKPGDHIRIRAKEYNAINNDRFRIPEGEYVHIFFEDNGKGMSSEVRRKAFDPLFTTKEKGEKKGKGLGLAMVYNIITRAHNGYIEIESTEDQGTTFHIYLPKAQYEKPPQAKERSEIKGGSETILLVDDEETILKLVGTVLTKYGYNIKTAIDGEQALEIYKEYKDSIDAVILDLIMPKMSGKMILERMLDINPNVKIIISSGHSEEDEHEAIISKARGYLKKPFKLQDLAQTVRKILDL